VLLNGERTWAFAHLWGPGHCPAIRTSARLTPYANPPCEFHRWSDSSGNKRYFRPNNAAKFLEAQEMNRTEKMAGRSAVILAMAVIILSVTGTASASCVVEREILVFCYT
jgi:hypothetical protein